MRDIALDFEGKYHRLLHSKNDGILLTFSVHPSDMPVEVIQDTIGQRYKVALVRINDQDEPEASPQQEEGIRAVTVAGVLCNDKKFQQWCAFKNYANEIGEEHAVQALYEILGIKSRRELRINNKARDSLFALRDEFADDMRTGQFR